MRIGIFVMVVAAALAACGDNLKGNGGPVVVDRQINTPEDTPVTILVAATDDDSAPLTLSFGVAAHGTVTQSGSDRLALTYTPEANYHGPDAFTVTVSDGALTASATIELTVTPVNDAPVAVDDARAAAEDVAVTITVATLVANDTDVDDDPLTITAVGAASTGTVALAAGTVTFTPAANFAGTATFEYTVSDGTLTDTGTVTVAVGGDNDPPIAVDDAATTAEDTARTLLASTLTANDTDPEGQALTVTGVANPSNGTVALTAGMITFTPTANFTGAAGFDYTVSDGAASDTGRVVVTVTPVNDGPVATAGTATTNEDVAVTITLAGTDLDGNPLTFTIVTSPTTGTLGAITPATATTATVVYTPNANAVADDSFTFRVNDGTTSSAPATVTIDVVPVNDGPVANDDADTVERNTPLVRASVFYTANDADVDGPALTVTGVDNPVNGTVMLVAGTVTFVPTAGFVGQASFEYQVSDGFAGDTGRVVVTVVETNTAPSATDDTATTAEDTLLVVTGAVVTGNDVDPDAQLLTVTAVQNPVNGTVVLDAGDARFTPAANYSGPASFEYVVSDGSATDVGLVVVTVTPVNDAPIATDDSATVAEDAAATVIDVLANDRDVESAPTVSAVTQPANGVVTIGGGGAGVSYQPTADFSGTDTFTYTVADGTGGTATATVTVTVTPVNDAPVAQGQSPRVPENAPATITLTATDVDVPAQQLTFSVGTGPSQGTLGAVTSTGPTTATVVYTPTANYVGPDSFTFTATDGTATSAPATVEIAVNNVVVCNDGVVEAPETCDDQGTTAGDGCSATCQTEPFWACTGAPSACDPICNDGTVIAGEEACDDGNPVDTDGCTTRCQRGQVCAATNASLAAGDRFATDPATGTCYVSFDDDIATSAAAQTACIASGGHLVTITSAGEQTLAASVQNTSQNPWIGATDAVVEGTFTWITGEAFAFTHWAANQPDNAGDEDCTALLSVGNAPAGEVSRWNDVGCDNTGFTAGRICELAASSCGDGLVQLVRGEQCDDRNTTSFDGCSATCQDETNAGIFFSEYVEGSSGNNKAVEIYNPFNTPFDLTGCAVRLYSNGAVTAGATLALNRTIASRDVLVICHAQSSASILANCDVTVPGAPVATAIMNFNGDDALDLVCNSGTVVVDSIGQVGVDPGSEWGTGVTSTADNVLRRKCSVTKGDSINNDAFTPVIATQWGGFADTAFLFGTYECVP